MKYGYNIMNSLLCPKWRVDKLQLHYCKSLRAIFCKNSMRKRDLRINNKKEHYLKRV